ncbi:glycosyltransferase [Kaistella palustris]|uniref:glycosyltransferase n=1 Tax=Kaistella palustris TaxID=493376 RepID=UPI0004267A3D|nr:glycosyltransferase [Kaistella palustris]
MQKKNILFISSWFPNKAEPTNGNFVQRHAEAVSGIHSVEVLHAIGIKGQSQKFAVEKKMENGLKILTVYYRNSSNPAVNFLRRMQAYSLGFKKLKKPDLVHANVLHNNMLFAVYLKKRYSIPFVVTEHWTALRRINAETTSSNIKRIAKFIGNQAEMVLPVSQDLLSGLRFLGISTPMKVIPNVVNTKLFEPKEKPNGQFTFIHVSNLIARKNPEKILNAALKLMEKGNDLYLKIGGDGDVSHLEQIRQRSRFKNNIEIFGIQTLPQIAAKMKSADCFILLSDDENQPCVIAESFASGLNVISTNVGGISEFFPESAGILLEKPDEDLLEKAMVKIMSSEFEKRPEFLTEYAAEIFSVEAIAKQFSDVYTAILK